MISEIRLPKLGETMTEAIVVKCSAKAGDEVKKGDVVMELETDKVAFELEAPESGFIKQILVKEGQTVSVGSGLIILGGEGEAVDSSVVAADAGNAAVLRGAVLPVSGLHRKNAKLMLESKREKPCFYLTLKADITGLCEYQAKRSRESGAEIVFDAFLMRALALGLKQYPVMAGRLSDGEIVLPDVVSIGFSVNCGDDVVFPVVGDVLAKKAEEISVEMAKLTEKAGRGELEKTYFEGGCITIDNLGKFGVEVFVPIVLPGQCSIVGVGRVMDAFVGDNAVQIRKIVNLTIATDHKVANGAYAAQFLDCVRKLLEEPEKL